MVDDDDDDESPSPEPRTDSRSALSRGFRAWWRLRIVKRDDFFSPIFSPKQLYRVRVGVGRSPGGPRGRGVRPKGGAPHPHGKGVSPLVFIFGEDFLLFIVRYSMEFQVIPRTFVFCT